MVGSVVSGSGRCACGAVNFLITQPPLLRAYCHCTICQKFNESNFADVTAFYATSVSGVNESAIDFRVYKQPPFVIRGKCSQCKGAAIEKVKFPFMPRMVIVPSRNIEDARLLPDPTMHIFYGTRVEDIDDDLKKYSAPLLSRIAFTVGLINGMLLHRKSIS